MQRRDAEKGAGQILVAAEAPLVAGVAEDSVVDHPAAEALVALVADRSAVAEQEGAGDLRRRRKLIRKLVNWQVGNLLKALSERSEPQGCPVIASQCGMANW